MISTVGRIIGRREIRIYMRNGFKVGKLFGIDIRIDWSWLLILLLVTWNLSTVFGNMHQDWSNVFRWGIAVLAALLFFASVLLHELAHSLVARARGISVRDITLFLFGGVSNIQREPPSPRAEFLIAALGPITSIMLGLGLVLGVGLSNPNLQTSVQNPSGFIASLGAFETVFLWLGSVNIFLGFFNLIPGFPLDGGRIMRSIFWVLTDNLRKATRWASWIGQGIGWVMIITGVAMAFGAQVPIFGSGVVNGIWLIFIGWFLNASASRSYQRVVVQDILEDVPVDKMMHQQKVSVVPQSTVSSLVNDHVMRSDERAFPVLENDTLLGIVTLDDIRSTPRADWDSTSVREIMTQSSELITMEPDEDAAEALTTLTVHDISQIPIVQESKLLGMLRRRDIVRWMQLQADIGVS